MREPLIGTGKNVGSSLPTGSKTRQNRDGLPGFINIEKENFEQLDAGTVLTEE